MNRRETAQGAGSFLGAATLVISGSLATIAVAGISHPGTPLAAGAQPNPTATTAPATPRPVKSTGTPSPSTSGPAPSTQTVEVTARTGQRFNPASAHKPHSAPTTAAPQPSPTTQQPAPAAQTCNGQILTVQLLSQCVSLGGSK